MSYGLAMVLTGAGVAVACGVLGTFLVLRRMAMVADAISHAILPGLVAGYWLANGPSLAAGLLGAVAAALLMVGFVELLTRSGLVAGDAAIGVAFPALFALGTVLITRHFSGVHLDADAILYGNIEFAGLDVWRVGGRVLGPRPVWVGAGLALANTALVVALFKELKVSTFDPGLAATVGLSPAAVQIALMTAVAFTAAGAFSAVGAVLAVAFFIVPAATAYLWTNRLPRMVALSAAFGAASAVLGFTAAVRADTSVAGAMACAAGVLFGLSWLFAPKAGLVPRARQLARQRLEFAAETLAVHLMTHTGTPAEAEECTLSHLGEHLRWNDTWATAVVAEAVRRGWAVRDGERLRVTDAGRGVAKM